MDITFDFACQDDCLDRMVPSDLRALIRERDDLRAQLEAAEKRATEAERERDQWKTATGLTGIAAEDAGEVLDAREEVLSDAIRSLLPFCDDPQVIVRAHDAMERTTNLALAKLAALAKEPRT